MTIEAIIFDMDGTIVDTETPDYQSWLEVYRAHGLDLDIALWKQRVGHVVHDGASGVFNPAHHFEKLTGRPLDPVTRRHQQRRYMALCEQQPPLPGVMDLLRYATAHAIPLGIASNSDRDWVYYWLRFLGLVDFFGCVYTRDDVENPKPAPEVYLRAAAHLGAAPARCIGIEDSPLGMRAVNAAGMWCVAVPNHLTAHLERPEVALTVSSLAEIEPAALLARFCGSLLDN